MPGRRVRFPQEREGGVEMLQTPFDGAENFSLRLEVFWESGLFGFAFFSPDCMFPS